MLSTLLPALVLFSFAAEDAAKADLKKFEGTWTMISCEQEGKKLSEAELKAARLVIKGNKHTVKVGEETIVGTHTLDGTKTPKTIDAMDTEGPFKGKTTQGIYQFDGDQLKVCFANPGDPRPKDFTSGAFTHVWKRAKSKK